MTSALFVLLAGLLSSASAQEVTGLQAAAAIESAMVDAVAKSERSVVAIARVRRDQPADAVPGDAGIANRMTIAAGAAHPGDPDFVPNEYATGVVIDRDGLILTNYHVLDEESDFWVTTADRRPYRARIKAADPRSDLAVLEIAATDLQPITFGDASSLRKGQIVLALGNPYSIARDGSASVSWGIVANLSRKVAPSKDSTGTPQKDKLYHFGTLIQTDARLNLGTSGGALLNLKGEMVGLTTSLAATSGFEQAAGYAIPVDETFLRAVQTLKEGREVEYGFLGVSPQNLNIQELQHGRHGVRVASVLRGTPAARYELRPDDVITHVDGLPVHDADALMLNVGRRPVEQTVRLAVHRSGRQENVSVRLGKFYVAGQKIVTVAPPSWRGLQVDYATAVPDLQRRTGSSGVDLGECVVIREVLSGSPAAQAGLQAGMFVSHVAGVPVRTPRDFALAIEGKTDAVEVRLVGPVEGSAVRRIAPEAAQ